jgi:hypothetical protein
MSNLKTFLKALHKSGYPNTEPDVPTIAKMVDYPVEFFLKDLVGNIGMEAAHEFVEKSFSKLGLMGQGMEVDLSDSVGEEGSYIYLIINGFDIKLDDAEPIWIHYTWGPNELIHDGESKTLEDIYDEVDFGTMYEYDELMDEIQYACQKDIFNKTGFRILFDSQI